MNDRFKRFLNQIPSDIRQNTDCCATANIAVFRPRSFVSGSGSVILEDYHFAFPTSNPPAIKIENNLYQFKKGRLITFVPDTKMMCVSEADTRPYVAMNIKKQFFEEIAYEATGKKPSLQLTDNPYRPKLLHLIEDLEEEIIHDTACSPLAIQSISTQIVIWLLRETGKDSKAFSELLPEDKNYIKIAREFMNTYYDSNIKIEDICKQIHISPYYFIRMYKERTGKSPHEYLLSVRMGKADGLLKKGHYSIDEVAKLSGFINTSHFSKCFKRVMGVSPSRYKKEFFIVK